MEWFEQFNTGEMILLGLLLAVFFEMVTSLFRFAFYHLVIRFHRTVAILTGGYHVHHAFIGIIFLIIGLIIADPGVKNIAIFIGVGLLVSDLLHHFVVLWIVTGQHEFQLRYHH
ncbi:MAG: hypothetical protein V1838_02135 [Patescibacteria group bacterium]